MTNPATGSRHGIRFRAAGTRQPLFGATASGVPEVLLPQDAVVVYPPRPRR